MQEIVLKPQSVILTIAPTNAGKSYFTTNHLIPALRDELLKTNKTPNIQHISSDNIRRELMGYNPFSDSDETEPLKNNKLMAFASEQAFKLLRDKLVSAMSFPINADFIIVDTTGLSKEFRDEIQTLTNQNNYYFQPLMFDYQNIDDYFKYSENSGSFGKKDIRESLKRMNDKRSEFSKKQYHNLIKIRTNDFSKYIIKVDNLDWYGRFFLPKKYEYTVISDVHGCYDELKELIIKNNYVIDENDMIVFDNKNRIVLIGDIVDKGTQIKEVIEFVYKNLSFGMLYTVLGNHENYVYKAVTGQLSSRNKELEDKYFDSIKLLEADTILLNKFRSIVEGSKEFLATDDFIVTHAPCKNIHLGKVTGISLKSQRNIVYPKSADYQTHDEYVEGVKNFFEFLRTESRYNHPLHIMGHVMIKRSSMVNNKIMIDTGCVAGGKLTSITVNKNKAPFIQHVPSRLSHINDELLDIFPRKDKIIDLDSLEPYTKARIKFLINNKVNFISGTMSPANKVIIHNELESLFAGLSYYKENGINKVILEKKYMGSRMQAYVFTNDEKSYMVSRNGYLVKENLISNEIQNKMLDQVKTIIPAVENCYGNGKRIKLLIADCESLPWSLLGSGLINDSYLPITYGVKSENQLLKEYGFEDKMTELLNSDEYVNYIGEKIILSKEELTTKYGYTKERTFRNLSEYKHMSIDEETKYFNMYERQLEVFGNSNIEPKLQPFALLKIVFDDDTEMTFENESNIEMYELIGNDEFFVVDLTNENFYELAKEFYDKVTVGLEMEGVVIKPEKVYNNGIAPYLKVRNKNYLTITYGHNYMFESKFTKLINRKNIRRKLDTSIVEFDLGMKMLKTKYSDINQENLDYKQLVAKMVVEVENEKTLDPRL